MRFSYAFHEAEIDGLPPPPKRPMPPAWERLAKVEELLTASRADIRHLDCSQAFYDRIHDFIQMPLREQFPSGDLWGATVLHELGHWSGHSSRLARLTDLNPFGSPEYAREELRAEIASLMLGDELGIGHDPARHASYVASWIKVLEQDPNEVQLASLDAARIVRFIHGLTKSLEVEAPKAPAHREPLDLAAAKLWEPWHDPSIAAVVFVESPEDVPGHQAAHPNPAARYVVLGDAAAIPDVAALPLADRCRTPVREVLDAIHLGRNRAGEPSLAPVTFEVAMAHTKDGHALGKRVRAAIEEAGLGATVVMPFNIGKRWADEGRVRGVGQALAR